MSEGDQCRVIIVVGGVTSTQGDGSAVAGRRITGNGVQAWMSTEELDLMRDPLQELEHLRNKKKAETDRYWRAGCSEELPAQFCGRWTETYSSNGITRRPSTHSLCLRLRRSRAGPGTRGRRASLARRGAPASSGVRFSTGVFLRLGAGRGGKAGSLTPLAHS